MKILNISIALVLLCGNILHAENANKTIKGPKGGKVLSVDNVRAEFFVNPEHKVEVSFYDQQMKPMAITEQKVNVIAEAKSGKSKLEMERNGETFISKSALPEGDGYTIVVQIFPKVDSRPNNFRITYHDEICKECKMAEYACICESHGAEEGHSH